MNREHLRCGCEKTSRWKSHWGERDIDPELDPQKYFVNSVDDDKPADQQDHPDPFILATASAFFRFSTQNEKHRLPISVGNLGRWSKDREGLPRLPFWNDEPDARNFWAPDVVQRRKDKMYILTLSSGVNKDYSTGHVIAMGHSKNLAGPYTLADRPLVDDGKEGFHNIDSTFFWDPETGQWMLYWGSGGQPLKARALGADMMSWERNTSTKEVLEPTSEYSLVEAPYVIYQRYNRPDRRYIMMFSTGDCCGDSGKYRVLLAIASNAFGPFKVVDAFLEGSDALRNPGHHCIIRKPDGSLFYDEMYGMWAAAHAVKKDEFDLDGKRKHPGQPLIRGTSLAKVSTRRDGLPYVQNGQLSHDVQRLPAA